MDKNCNIKILVTGGNGFVGKHLVERLISDGFDVVVTTRSLNTQVSRNQGARILHVCYENLPQLTELFKQENPQYIVHLASGKDRLPLNQIQPEKIAAEIQHGANVAYAAMEIPDIKRFVFIGTSDQYDFSNDGGFCLDTYNPANSYGYIKSAMSLLIKSLYKSSSFPAVQLIPSIIYGPGQGDEMFLPSLIRALTGGEEIEMSKGEQFRDFIYVADVVDAILKALFTAPNACVGKTYSVCSGLPIQLIDVVRAVVEETRSDFSQVLVGKRPYRAGESMTYFSNYSEFAADSGWAPTTNLRSGIRKILGFE
jgi:UDP-glucose 4-epimerase